MPTLEGAVALTEVDAGAFRIQQELDLDVSRSIQVPLEDQSIVSKGGARLTPRGAQHLAQVRGSADRRASLCPRHPRSA